MRILVVSNLYPPIQVGGYEARCAATSQRLGVQHEVHVLTSTTARRRCPPDSAVRRELPLLPLRRRSIPLGPLASARAMRVMRRTLAELRPDLIFVWNGSYIPQAALQVAHDSGIPIAYSVGEYWFGQLYEVDPFMRFLFPGKRGVREAWGRVARALNRLFFQLDPLKPARAAVCWNSDATRRICGLPTAFEPTLEATIYPGVPQPERWTSLRRRPAATPTIAYVGRAEPEKGPDVAYRAIAHLRAAHGIEARLVLVGSCSQRHRAGLDRLAAELDIAHLVELRGPLDSAGVGQVLEQAHALVVPSTWDEPFGIVLLEAALARVPVVASLSGGMPEALREDTEALFFPKEDAEACADALADTLSHPQRTAVRVAAAARRADELSFERYIAGMEQFVVEARASFEGDIP